MAQAVLVPTTSVSQRTWTVAEVERMSPEFRYEIVEGVLYVPPMPFWPHPDIVSELHLTLGSWVRDHALGKALPPQTGIYLNEVNYIDPDIIYLRPSQVPRIGERCRTAALAVEVVSPSNLRASREEREALYRRAGVEELWYVDFPARHLEVRRLRGPGYETHALFEEGDTVSSSLFPGLQFPLAALWKDVRE